jgi:hypothetical protein
MQTLLCIAVGTACHQHELEACPFCVADLGLEWKIKKKKSCIEHNCTKLHDK